jgi:predicted GNAT family N-acyltransferase
MNTHLSADFHVEPADYEMDFKDLRTIRETVFVIEQRVPLELEWDELDPRCHHMIARDREHRPIGTGRLTPEHKIGRMAVLKEWRGKGVGEALLQALIDEARRLGWSEVNLHAQASAIGFYEKFAFEPVGERFQEAGIEHLAMRLALIPLSAGGRPAAPARGPSKAPEEFHDYDKALEATRLTILAARREILIYTRGLDPAIYGHALVVEALKDFAIADRGGVVQLLIQDPTEIEHQSHPLLLLAQRLPSVFEFRTPIDLEDLQYPSAFMVNDRDGICFWALASRNDGEWSPAQPARNRQLREFFERTWARCRPCTEFRTLGL